MYRNDFPLAVEELTQTVTGKAGVLKQVVRQAIVAQTTEAAPAPQNEDSSIPANLQAYLNKVAYYSYKVTDNDIKRLKQAGYTEDELFEACLLYTSPSPRDNR